MGVSVTAGLTSSNLTGPTTMLNFNPFSVHVNGVMSSGSGSAVVVIEVSNDGGTTWLTVGTISLTLTTTPSADGFHCMAPFERIRARATSVSANGTVNAYFAVKG